MYWLRKRLLSQNFLVNRQLVRQLIRNSSIGKQDLVLEIGPGRGIITQELLYSAGNVESTEIDPSLYRSLVQQFSGQKNLKISCGNFLHQQLPDKKYKVFSNIPFSITGDIIRKLLYSPNPPKDCYLIVQKEAADKYLVHQNKNTMVSILLHPWWDIKTVHMFSQNDFQPKPRVNSVLLHLQPRSIPLWSGTKEIFQDLVVHTYTRNKASKNFNIHQWLDLVKNLDAQKKRAITGSFDKLLREQQKLHKIHRTRLDKDWKKYCHST